MWQLALGLRRQLAGCGCQLAEIIVLHILQVVWLVKNARRLAEQRVLWMASRRVLTPLLTAGLPDLTHGLGRRCQPQPTPGCFTFRAWAVVQAQKRASWLVQTHASLVRRLLHVHATEGIRGVNVPVHSDAPAHM